MITGVSYVKSCRLVDKDDVLEDTAANVRITLCTRLRGVTYKKRLLMYLHEVGAVLCPAATPCGQQVHVV
jgi:hypothetical protein